MTEFTGTFTAPTELWEGQFGTRKAPRVLNQAPYRLHGRSADPDSLEGLISRRFGTTTRPWRMATVETALGVPAIYRAVTLISNVVGSLTLKAFRNGSELADVDRPTLIKRPSPFTIPREFFRETAYSMAVYGEAWWLETARDSDDLVMGLMPIDPTEITVERDPDNPLPTRDIITWRGRRFRRGDRPMHQIVMSKGPGDLRGQGPLQRCRAAVSVAVEAQEWAANFYADGGTPPYYIKSADFLGPDPATGEHEATRLREKWMSVPHNQPRVIDQSIEDIKALDVNVEAAQMFEAREFSNGDAAREFGIPGPFLGHSPAGSSLTYQNLATLFDDLLRGCLLPNYLEPMEQTMSDFLTRSTVARFNTDALLRADPQTRYAIYSIGIDKGIFGPEYAQAKEGIVAGDIENAPVPFAPPLAFPDAVPQLRSVAEFRCQKCRRLLAEAAGPGTRIRCRCGTANVVAA